MPEFEVREAGVYDIPEDAYHADSLPPGGTVTAPDIAEIADLVVRSAYPKARAQQRNRLASIEDYLFIGGDRMPAAAAARRLGVTERTVTRYRAVLRRAGADGKGA